MELLQFGIACTGNAERQKQAKEDVERLLIANNAQKWDWPDGEDFAVVWAEEENASKIMKGVSDIRGAAICTLRTY